MALTFEWDDAKARRNASKHGISFEEAVTIFADPQALTIDDPDHSTTQEERYVTGGRSHRGRILVVTHCDDNDRIRIISARKATQRERDFYAKRD